MSIKPHKGSLSLARSHPFKAQSNPSLARKSPNSLRRTMDEEDFSSKISVHPLEETVCVDVEDTEDLTNGFILPSSDDRQNVVFWDVVQYPIPPGVNLESVTTSIRAALDKMGLYSCERIIAYGDRMNHSKDDLRNTRILHKPQGEMALDLLVHAYKRSPRNFMVIPRPDPTSELHRVLKCLQSRHNNILLVNPEAHAPFLFDSESESGQSIVDCIEDLDGGKPIIGGTRMGDTTPVIKDFSSLASLFEGPERKAFVFWDVTKYPNPTRANVVFVGTGVRAALQRLGHHGCVEILAFGADQLKLNHSKYDWYKEARIIRIPQELYAKACEFWVVSNPGPLMIIPTPDPDSNLHRFLTTFLKAGRFDVLSVEPPVDEDTPQDVQFLHHPDLILGCTDGSYEANKITRGRRERKDIQDFSKPIIFEKGATAGEFVFVFWNLEDFPFPGGWKPDAIYAKIESAFLDAGYELRNMLIWAYVDDKEGSWGGDFLEYKTWESSIYFLPGGGDKSARRNRMLHDILLWTVDLESTPADLVIVSNKDKIKDDKEFSSRLNLFERMHYNVFVEPGSSFF